MTCRDWIQQMQRAGHLGQPTVVNAEYAATTGCQVAILTVLNQQTYSLPKQGDFKVACLG